MEVLILGAGTAGTMAAAGLRKRLPAGNRITVVDTDDRHVYQPGLLLLPFGVYDTGQIVKSRRAVLPRGVDLVTGTVEVVDPEGRTVTLTDGRVLRYDQLVIATGTSPRPDQTPGMADTPGVHEFYTLEGSQALREALAGFSGGKLVVGITEMPIKCPVAPLEFAFLVDAHLRKRGIRDRTQITYVTPLDGAFTKAVCSRELGHLLTERDIVLETDFMLEHIEDGKLVSYDEREIDFDLLVTVPINMGADYIAKSGLGDELNYVPTDKHTLRAEGHDDVWVVGDAGNLPTSKAGSVAHFSMEVFLTNFMDVVAGRAPTASFDGHSNCFIESGDGKALLIDFNYEVEPLPGTYPLPTVGLPLLRESRFNHLGKLAFRYMYWYALLPERKLPIPSAMSMRGKKQPAGH
ncbi:MAG: NAD(P)/FAD-dependent oxidoreductase [Cellulomonas sp.]|nr:NAD(P)/FAD-dependent oxidoreductase [Cellulomonas sp.]